jgi:hypothetical protein
VNLSPVQFRTPNLYEAVTNALSHSGLAADRLELEITESALLSNQDSTVLRQLRALGVRIAMDDFGTGHSSLAYLRSFPFDKIKIDRCFIHDLSTKKDCRAIISAVSQLAISLGIALHRKWPQTRRSEVGFVSGTVARQTGRFLGIRFILPPSVERDLLIRKMFTAGLDTTHVDASAWSATGAMLKSIWGMRTEMLERKIENTSDVADAAPIEKLPARSLLISPQPRGSQSYLHLTQVQLPMKS